METTSDLSPADIQQLASSQGLRIPEGDLAEVTHRFNALLEQLRKLDQLPLDDVDPAAIFPKEAGA